MQSSFLRNKVVGILFEARTNFADEKGAQEEGKVVSTNSF